MIGGLLGLGAALSDAVIGAWSCTSETANCNPGGSRIRWEGRLFDSVGRPGARVPLTVDFVSVNEHPDVTTRTDAEGRFCFRWPREQAPADVRVGYVTARGRRDPRFANGAPLDPAAHDPQLEAGRVPAVSARAVVLTPNRYLVSDPSVFLNYRDWDAQLDATPHCEQTAAPPWYRQEGALGNWRSVLVIAVGLFAFVGGLVGLPFRRRRGGYWIAGLVMTSGVASVVAFFLAWGPRI